MHTKRLIAALALASLATPALAHRAWLLPSATVFSGTDEWVSVDAAISNDLFYADHFPMPTDGIKVWAPDGSAGELQNVAKARYRSTFDVRLAMPGTWKIGTVESGVSGTFKVNGEDWSVGRRRGPPPAAGAAAAPLPAAAMRPAQTGGDGEGQRRMIAPGHSVATVAEIPANATDLQLTELSTQNVIFVTAGAPTETVFRPANKGLEMAPVTHPDALVSDEPAKFRFLVDGKPAAGLKVTLIPGGKRFRESEGLQEVTTGSDGIATVTWAMPGMYWVNATLTDDHPTLPRATQRRLSYTTTLEVTAP